MRRGILLGVRVDPNIKKELNELVKVKYSSLRGGLRLEVEAALREHLAMEHTTQHTNIEDPRLPKVLGVCNSIASRLHKSGYDSVSRNDLAAIIGTLRGSDRRTVEKWTTSLLTYGFIQHSENPLVFKILDRKLVEVV